MPLYAVVGGEDYLRDSSRRRASHRQPWAPALRGIQLRYFSRRRLLHRRCLSLRGGDSGIRGRVVVYKSVEKLPAREGEKLLSYLASPNETTTFICGGGQVGRSAQMDAGLNKAGGDGQCAPLRDAQLSAWIRQEAAALGVRMQEDAIQLLKEVGVVPLCSEARVGEACRLCPVRPDRTIVRCGGAQRDPSPAHRSSIS